MLRHRQTSVVVNRVIGAGKILTLGQPPIQNVELALHLHREAVDRIFDLGRRVGTEMPEAASS
jgi:hypothetical protein